MLAERRIIRLKETAPNMDVMRARPEGYAEGTDGTVGEGPWRCRTDSNGFIITGNDVPLDYPAIVFLGDSFVEATFTPEDARFVSIIERGLQDRGVHFRCLNGGYSGATTLQLFNVFMNKVVPLVGEGGTVVFFIPQSDLPIYFRPHSYWYPTERYAPIIPPFEPEAVNLPKGSPATAAILRLLICAAREFKINLVLVSSPHRHADEWGQDDYLSRILSKEKHDSLSQRRADIRLAVEAVVRDMHPPFIDADMKLAETSDYFYDELHMNDAGHEKFSDWFIEELTPLIGSDAWPIANDRSIMNGHW